MGFNTLPSLIGKNLKMFFRSKVSSTVIILVPLLIIIFAGLAFNSSGLSNIQVGVYSESYSEFTNSVISDFEEGGFHANRYDSLESCVESIKLAESQICVIFPKDLNSDVSTEEIIFYVDYSRVNLADNLINEIQKSVIVKTSGVGENIAQELIDSLESVKSSLPNSKTKIDEALSATRNNKESGSELVFPTSDISSAILDLENIKDDVVEAEEGSVKDDIADVIVILKTVETKELGLSANLEDISAGQEEIISTLNTASYSLNNIIVSLNSGKSVSADNIVSPIETRIEAINADSNNGDYIVPIMLSLIALFGAILLSSTFVLKEKKSKAFFRNFMAPTKNISFILSTYLTCLIIMAIQFILIFIGSKYFLNINVLSFLGPLIAVLAIGLSAFIVIGMFIGYLFRSDETVIFSSMIMAILLMCFSNIILPLENISLGIVKFLKFNPLVVLNLTLKKIIFFNLGFSAIYEELIILGSFFVVFFVLNCIFRKMTRRIL